MKILTEVGFKLPFVPLLPGFIPVLRFPRFSKVLSRSPGPVSSHASKYK